MYYAVPGDKLQRRWGNPLAAAAETAMMNAFATGGNISKNRK